MEKSFKDQTVILSGGLGDIGRAIALEFARQGANIAIGDLLPASDANGLLAELKQFNIRCHYSQLDIADARMVQSWINEVEEELNVPDIIIPNAATVTVAGLYDLKMDEWDRELGINLNGAFYMSRAATARLVDLKKPGRVVFIGSWAAHVVHSHIPVYCVSKAGIRMLCKCMALELAAHNILVNELALGYVDGGLSGRLMAEDPEKKKKAIDRTPVKKLITVKEVAMEVIHLCHPQNQNITGSTVLMDGGLTLL